MKHDYTAQETSVFVFISPSKSNCARLNQRAAQEHHKWNSDSSHEKPDRPFVAQPMEEI